MFVSSFVVCLSLAARRLSFVIRCLFFVCLLVVVLVFIGSCLLLFWVCSVSLVVCRRLFVVDCLSFFVGRRLLFGVSCVLVVVCCLLFAV